MNVKTEQQGSVAIVRVGETRLMYPILSDFSSAVGGLIAGGQKRILIDMSPVTYVDKNDPPMLLIVGDADTTVPPEQSRQMVDRLESVGVKHELLVLPGVRHEFLGKTPQATRDANLKALAATFRFIDDVIGVEKTEPKGARSR